ncbi:TnsD family Tn7-like transposition protein [Lysinibacillus boronitolerans]|uniref:TnsD family Tn7-like transposition protein n=1 Tax=Lysinibacillus TaxID=400634 RepID=UPI00216166B5|nr:TnsD family Tn7-like transposition protein [Lysinibacillus boronitolerans]MCS1394209.1 TnsD family Tn7-like transposition protein [Lysinibacillus boronitolerans]
MHLLSWQVVSLKYRGLLRDLELVTASNRIRQKDLYKKLKQVLPVDFLVHYESKVDVANEYEIRSVTYILFLEQEIDEFTIDLKTDIGPFGKGPFPCLNRAALHYHKLVISSVDVTRDYKTNAPVGTFKCTYGFIYSRKGPDKTSEDRFHIGRVKEFRHVWQEKLKQLAKSDISIRAIAREIGVDSKTVKRYLLKSVEVSKETLEYSQELLAKYKQDIEKIVQEYPQLSRTTLRKKCKKQYMFLYRHDKEWLMSVLPFNQKRQQPTITVNWSKRDQDYVVKIKKIHKELS